MKMNKRVYIRKEYDWITIIGEYTESWLSLQVNKFLYWKPNWFKVQKAKWYVRRKLNEIIKTLS